MRESVLRFMQKLEMPKEFMNIRVVHSLILLLDSRISNIENRHHLLGTEFQPMATDFDEIKLPFGIIFKENNIEKR